MASPIEKTATLFWTHLSLIAVLAGTVAVLFRMCPRSLTRIGVIELIVFGLPALFFVLIQSEGVVACGASGYLSNPVAPWLLLMFTYSIFIPNSIRRGAARRGPDDASAAGCDRRGGLAV